MYTKRIGRDTAALHIEVETSDPGKRIDTVRLLLTGPAQEVAWQTERKAQPGRITFDVALPNPKLWWPNGVGDQPLYQLTAMAVDSQGNVLHSHSVETAVRTVELEEIPDAQGEGTSFTFKINGVRIFAKGANWVPADPFPARVPKEKYDLLITQAKHAGMNMLRIWGGGIYESDYFYHLCNKNGIMIWQDFMLSCAQYPDDQKGFQELLTKEFEANVRRLRNNPALVLWCGGNELGFGLKASDDWTVKEFHLTVTEPMLKRLDPSRTFWLTSPWSRGSLHNHSHLSGDAHMGFFRPTKTENYRAFAGFHARGRFMSEQFTCGVPPKRSLMKFMTEEDLYTAEMLEYHTRDNPHYKRGLSLFRQVEHDAALLYGDPGDDQDRWLSQMGYVQYELVRLALEAARRRKFYSSGMLFWMFNDNWPASGWALVDYWGDRKASWYAAAAGNRPIIAASDPKDHTVEWFVTSDLMRDANVTVNFLVQPVAEKNPRWSKTMQLTVPANSSVMALELQRATLKEQMGDDAVLVCEISYDGGWDRSYWTPEFPKAVQYQPTTLHVEQRNDSAFSGEVTIQSTLWARVVTLDAADADFEDNYFEMLPGETRTIGFIARSPVMDGDIRVSCWNQ